jgi:predicted transcriptional regulator
VVKLGHRRGEVKILLDILSISVRGVKVTHLMYKANLSHSTLRKYLLIMSKRGLITTVCNADGSMVYYPTEKGKLVLNRLKEVREVLSA